MAPSESDVGRALKRWKRKKKSVGLRKKSARNDETREVRAVFMIGFGEGTGEFRSLFLLLGTPVFYFSLVLS